MVDLNNRFPMVASFLQQYILLKGFKKFGLEGKQATMKGMEQMHNCKCFEPISIKDLNNIEQKKAKVELAYLSKNEMVQLRGEQYIMVSLQGSG